MTAVDAKPDLGPCPICGLRPIPPRKGKCRQMATCKDPACRKKYMYRRQAARVSAIRKGTYQSMPAVSDLELERRIAAALELSLPHVELHYLGKKDLGGFQLNLVFPGTRPDFPDSLHVQTREQAVQVAGEFEQVVEKLREWGKQQTSEKEN